MDGVSTSVGGPLRPLGPGGEPGGDDAVQHRPAPREGTAPAPVVRGGAAGPTSSAWAVRVGASQGAAQAAAAPTPGPRAALLPLLKPGARGAAVTELHALLNAFRERLGLKPLASEAALGVRTQDALKAFQRLHGLKADGAVNTATWRRLLGEASPTASSPVPGTITWRVLQHRDAILAASRETGLPAAILAAVIEKESGGTADALGAGGQRGVLQLDEKAHAGHFATRDWRDARANILYGAHHLRRSLDEAQGDPARALAAFRVGMPAVKRGLREGKTLDEIAGKPNYVSNVLKYAERYGDFL